MIVSYPSAIASSLVNTTLSPRVAGSTSSTRYTNFFPPAQCFIWHLEIFPTQNNGSFISIIFLLYSTKMNCWSKPLVPERTSAWIADRYNLRADDFMLGLD